MYPYIQLGDAMISMTGLGIVVSLCVFLLVVFLLVRKAGLPYMPFFLSLPVMMFLVYGLGKYSYMAIEYGTRIPKTFVQLKWFVWPITISFHYIGIVAGIFLYIWFFLRYKTKKVYHTARLHIFFVAITTALIPLGIFLVLGDHMIGKTTNSLIAVHALTEHTRLADFGAQVYPVGLFLSFGAFITLLVTWAIDHRTKKQNGLLGFTILFFMISIVLTYQQYPLHGVMKLLTTRVDIKQYVSRFGAIFLLILHTRKNI